jgi:integrase/recombinase XerD
VEDSLNLFIQHLELEKGRSKNTLFAYKNDIGQFLTVLEEQSEGPLLPEGLSDELVTRYQNWLNTKRYKPSTINRKWAAVRAFIDYLKFEGHVLPLNLLSNLEAQTVERTLPVFLTREEVEILLAAPLVKDSPLARRDSAILALMYFAGLRASDVVSLTLDEVDVERSVIHSPWSRSGLISIPNSIEPIRNYLFHGRPHLARDPDERSLFLNQKGTGLTRQGLWLIVKRWVEVIEIDVKVTPHTLRHSLAKHLLETPSGSSINPAKYNLD